MEDRPDTEPLALPPGLSVLSSATGGEGPGSGEGGGGGPGSSLVLESVFVCSPLELISTVFPSPLLRRMTGIPPDMRQLIIIYRLRANFNHSGLKEIL